MMKRSLLALAVLLAAAGLPAEANRIRPAASAPAEASVPRAAIRAALSYLGVPYVSGGMSRAGLDCSGLVYCMLRDSMGSAEPRGVGALFRAGTAVMWPIHLGDLLFFDTESRGLPSMASHVGIYAGNGSFIHAASEGSRRGVIVSRLSDPYYRDRFLGARRVLPWRAPVLDVVLTDTAGRVTSASPFPSRERMTIRVFNRMNGGGPMDLTLLKEGRRVLAVRIAPSDFGPALIPVVPEAGAWEVVINRLFKGRELERVDFTVEE